MRGWRNLLRHRDVSLLRYSQTVKGRGIIGIGHPKSQGRTNETGDLVAEPRQTDQAEDDRDGDIRSQMAETALKFDIDTPSLELVHLGSCRLFVNMTKKNGNVTAE